MKQVEISKAQKEMLTLADALRIKEEELKESETTGINASKAVEGLFV